MNAKEKKTNEKRMKAILDWTEEDIVFCKTMLGPIFTSRSKKIEKMKAFAATIKGNKNEKFEAVKKQFPEEF